MIKLNDFPVTDEEAVRLLTSIAEDMERTLRQIKRLLDRINRKEVKE